MEAEFSIGKKWSYPSTNFSKCIICQTDAKRKGKLQTLTCQGYKSLEYAVTRRTDDIAFRLFNHVCGEKDFMTKTPKWHISCRSNYTHKKNIDQHNKKAKLEEDVEESTSERSTTRSSVPDPTDYKKQCFICDKERDKGVWDKTKISSENR